MNGTSKIALLAAAIHAQSAVVAGFDKVIDFFKDELGKARDTIAKQAAIIQDDENKLAEEHAADIDAMLTELNSNSTTLSAALVANTPVATEVSPEQANTAAVNAQQTTQNLIGSATSATGTSSQTQTDVSTGSTGATGSSGGASDSSGSDSSSKATPFDTTAAPAGNPGAIIQPGDSPNQNFRTNVSGESSNPEQVGSSKTTQEGGGPIDNSGKSAQDPHQIDPTVSPIPSAAVASGDDGKVNGTTSTENAQPGTSTLEPPAPGAGAVDGLQPENNAAVTPGQAGIDANKKPSTL